MIGSSIIIHYLTPSIVLWNGSPMETANGCNGCNGYCCSTVVQLYVGIWHSEVPDKK